MTLSIVNINPHKSPIDFLCIWVFIIGAGFFFFLTVSSDPVKWLILSA